MSEKEYNFSPYVLKCLEAASWHPNRKIDEKKYLIDNIIDISDYNDNTLFDEVIKFISEFGGLYIKCPFFLNVAGTKKLRFADIDFRLDQMLTHINDEHVDRIGKKSCIIGKNDDGYSSLLMDQDGKVYLSNDTEFDLFMIAYSGYEAIERLCTNRIRRIFIGSDNVIRDLGITPGNELANITASA